MGAKQSQDSTASEPVQVSRPATREEEPVFVPSIFAPLSSNTTTSYSAPPSSSSTLSHHPQREENMTRGGGGGGGFRDDNDEDEEDDSIPPTVPIPRPYFPGLSSLEVAGLQGSGRSRSHHHRTERAGASGAVGEGNGGQHHRRSHHSHHSHHHHHHNGGGGERSGSHGRRSRRYVVDGTNSSPSEPIGMELAALSQRLRALQIRQNNESGSRSSGNEGNSRQHHHHRQSGSQPRHHSHSQSLPAGSLFFMRPERKSRCPMCGKDIPLGEMEVHMVMCITKPRVDYNEDQLQHDAGECTICLEDMRTGDHIARLPCLCIYHMKCLKLWFKKNQTCPEHPEFMGT